jgi:hypothetical protein
MKETYRFEKQDLGDKIKIILFVNNKRESALFKMKERENSSFENLKEAEENLVASYLASIDEGEL